MPKDPLIEELHDIRQRLWQDAGADMAAYFRQLKSVETQNRNRVIGPSELRKIHPELCSVAVPASQDPPQ